MAECEFMISFPRLCNICNYVNVPPFGGVWWDLVGTDGLPDRRRGGAAGCDLIAQPPGAVNAFRRPAASRTTVTTLSRTGEVRAALNYVAREKHCRNEVLLWGWIIRL